MMKKRKGMSLIEVVIAFVLVSMLIVMVSGAVTSTYRTSYMLQKLPTVYYAGQQAVETELANLDALIEEKYIIEKTIATQINPDQDLINRLTAINAELVGPVGGVEGNRNREHYTIQIFDKTVNVYRFEIDNTVEGVGTVHFYAGTASGVRYERPVPLLDHVTVSNVPGGQPIYAIYGAYVPGQTIPTVLYATPTYVDNAYLDYRAMNDEEELDHYLWYTSPSFPTPAQAETMSEEQIRSIEEANLLHSVYFADSTVTGTTGADDTVISQCMPVFPADLDGVYATDKRISSYEVTAEDLGKFICCAVTPQSVNDAMGATCVSNLVYVSALPVLTKADGTTKYKAVIDPSLIRVAEDSDHVVHLGSYSSWLPGTNCTLDCSHGGTIELHQEGSYTSEINDFKSRFIRISCNGNNGLGLGNTISTNLTSHYQDVIYMVVRDHLASNQSPSNINNEYIRSTLHSARTCSQYSNLQGRLEEDEDYDFSCWRVIRTTGPQVTMGFGEYRLYGHYDLAELIIVNNPTAEEEAQIRAYLGNKFRLN